jgi:hypothetical protein
MLPVDSPPPRVPAAASPDVCDVPQRTGSRRADPPRRAVPRPLAGLVGRTRSPSPLQGFHAQDRCAVGTSPSRGRPSQGSAASRSAPVCVAASSVRRSLRTVSTVSRSSAVRPASRPEGPRRLPQASPPSQGTGSPAVPGRVAGSPSWGSLPLQRRGPRGPLIPGLPHPARSVLGVSHPLDGFLPLAPCGLAKTAAAPGVLSLTASFRAVGPGRVAASAATSHVRCTRTFEL